MANCAIFQVFPLIFPASLCLQHEFSTFTSSYSLYDILENHFLLITAPAPTSSRKVKGKVSHRKELTQDHKLTSWAFQRVEFTNIKNL
jgi:hypothetical protein